MFQKRVLFLVLRWLARTVLKSFILILYFVRRQWTEHRITYRWFDDNRYCRIEGAFMAVQTSSLAEYCYGWVKWIVLSHILIRNWKKNFIGLPNNLKLFPKSQHAKVTESLPNIFMGGGGGSLDCILPWKGLADVNSTETLNSNINTSFWNHIFKYNYALIKTVF